ncbi:glucose 1-dehydrogenase [Bordetella pertussis]|nr:glucose 1-dehydrogenase [Bordetella pertussis]AZR86847.1 oxidoreductase [Bordetella pertussis]PNP05273.1 3-oxoacyl-ACP reductase [Bordetella pertussis 18323]UEB57594.1 SDR family oxidoreductase [Bordetella pertussis]
MAALDGKVAFITGASRGIGAAIARRLAADGADIALTYVSAADKAHALVEELRAAGRRAHAYAADAADAGQVREAVARAAADLGRLDILVNNAGIFLAGPVEDISADDYDRSMDINVRAVFVATQAALPHLGEGGRIVNIGSCLAGHTGRPGVALYAAGKAAVAAFTRALARELGPRGITANVVRPGPIDTDMNPAGTDQAAALVQMLAVPHYGEPADIANMVAYLAGPQARYVTGAELSVDGGYAA